MNILAEEFNISNMVNGNSKDHYQTSKILKDSMTVCSLSFILSHLLSFAPVVKV